MYRNRKSGFTLVEILIVVIILGILAAIVIPQFTNASQDARKSSLTSQLQTLRSQVELFKLQHHDAWPTAGATGAVTAAWDWNKLTTKTDTTIAAAASNAADAVGPYLQATPVNPICSDNTTAAVMLSIAGNSPAAPFGSAVAGPGGWVFYQGDGKLFATTKLGSKIFDEGNLASTLNDQ